MSSVLDPLDKLQRFPIAYNEQPLTGWRAKHRDETAMNQGGTAEVTQKIIQQVVGKGPWDALVRLYADAFPIEAADYAFHNGLPDDVADEFFPTEGGHPDAAYYSARLPRGLSDEQTKSVFGIFRTLRTANYDNLGRQIKANGDLVPDADDPRLHYFYKPNPANAAADQLIRWGQRPKSLVNWPAWVDWRDWNDELIWWDDASYTPRSLSLTPTSGGTLVAGSTYGVRVVTVKGAENSSASRNSASIATDSITLGVGETAFQVNWLLKEDIIDHTSFRVYVTDAAGAFVGYFDVPSPVTRSLLITTLSGVTAGTPPDVATAGLLIQIPRFECGLWFMPPYDLTTMLDRICQISCADWQWSGYGTGTYRNDMMRFMSPATRAPVFTLDLAHTAPGSFRTWPVDRKSRPNKIIGIYRDKQHEFLDEGEPVELVRDALLEADKQERAVTIDFGTAYRSQVQRGVSFYARVLCDQDQMAALKGSPKTYHVLPGDPVLVTNSTAVDWEDQEFVVIKKEEHVETGIGDPLNMSLYNPAAYSDTDHSPLPSRLPEARAGLLDAPPAVESVTLSESSILQADQTVVTSLRVAVQFSPSANAHVGRIYVKKTAEADNTYKDYGTIAPDPTYLQAAFEVRGVEKVSYTVKVVTETAFTAGTAVTAAYTVLGKLDLPPEPASLTLDFDGQRIVGSYPASTAGDTKEYEIYQVISSVEYLIPGGKTPALRFTVAPPAGWSAALVFRVYTVNWSGKKSAAGRTNNISPTLPGAGTIGTKTITGKHTSNGAFVQFIRGIYTFPTYTYGQMRAKVYLTSPGGAEQLTEVVLVPDASNQAAFTFIARGKGVHTVRIVAELAVTRSPSASSISDTFNVTNETLSIGDIPDFAIDPKTPTHGSKLVYWDEPADVVTNPEKIVGYEVVDAVTGGVWASGGMSIPDYNTGGIGGEVIYKGRTPYFYIDRLNPFYHSDFFVRAYDGQGNVSRWYGHALENTYLGSPLPAPTIAVNKDASGWGRVVLTLTTALTDLEVETTVVQIKVLGTDWSTAKTFTLPGKNLTPTAFWSLGGDVQLRARFDSGNWSSTVAYATKGEQPSQLVTIDFPSIFASVVEEQTATVTGVRTKDSVHATPVGTLEGGLTWNAFIPAKDQVTIRMANQSGFTFNPTSRQWRIEWLRRAFSPLEIEGLILWLSSRSITGLVDTNTVTTWNDLSGQDNHVTQATSGKRPQYRINRHGSVPAVVFDGVDDVMATASGILSGLTGYTVIHLMKLSSSGTVMGTGNGSDYIPYIAANDIYLQMGSYGVFTQALGSTFHTFIQRFDGAGVGNAARMQARLDGVAKTLTYGGTIPAAASASSALYIGASTAAAALPAGVEMVETLAVNRPLTTAEMIQFETYCADLP
jgi:hypothetical protein